MFYVLLYVTLLYVPSSFAIILMGKRELVALLGLSSWYHVVECRTKAHWDKSPLGQKPTGQKPIRTKAHWDKSPLGQKPTYMHLTGICLNNNNKPSGGTLIFSSYIDSDPASTVHPPPKNIKNFKYPIYI